MTSLVDKMKEKWQSPFVAGQGTIWFMLLSGCFISSLLIKMETISSTLLPTLVCLINGLALFSGGFMAGRKAKQNGWYYGLLQGLIYGLTLFVISFLAFDQGMSTYSLLLTTTACALTTLSGIVGVNTVKK